jgi:CRP-like cAMP-binding protein
MTVATHDLSVFETYFATAGAGKVILRFEKNAVIYVQGDPAEAVFYIQKGQVKLNVTSEHGKEAVVAIMEAGQFFGEGCLNGQALRVATAVSVRGSEIASMAKLAMREKLKNDTHFAQLFVSYLLARNSRIEEDLIDQLFNSSEQRLARLLLLLAHFGKEGVPHPIDIEISQETLAEMIGTTRSRVSFFMNKFRRMGLVSYNGKIHVHNSLLNAVLHEKPALIFSHFPMCNRG